MRVRLHIDVEWPVESITDLGELVTDQPAVLVTGVAGGRAEGIFTPGRLMDARPVEVES